MKSLRDFIFETSSEDSSKTITFNFAGLENEEETLKYLQDKKECVIDDKTVKITVTPENVKNLDSVQNILQQYADGLMRSSRRASDEAFAQKSRAFATKVGELNDLIDDIEHPESKEEKTDDNKKEGE